LNLDEVVIQGKLLAVWRKFWIEKFFAISLKFSKNNLI
jgi:hypothetical protein